MKRKNSTKQSGYNTDEERSKATRSIAASSGRAPKRTKLEKKCQLESDEWAMEVEAKRILCGGCNEWKKLGKDYEMKNWDTHKSKCHGITGMQNKRVFHGPDKFAEMVSIFIFELRFCWRHLHIHSSLPAQHPLHCSSNRSSVANPHLGRHRVL